MPDSDVGCSWIIEEQVPTVCREELVERCLGNAEFASRLARFRQDFEQGLGELRQAVEQSAPERIATIAHRLKGAAAVVAAHRLRRVSSEMELLGRAQEPARIPPCLAGLDHEWNRFLQSYQQ